MKNLSEEDVIQIGTNQVSTDVSSNPLGLNSVSNNPLGLNSVMSFLPVNNINSSPMFTGLQQIYDQSSAINILSDGSSVDTSLVPFIHFKNCGLA